MITLTHHIITYDGKFYTGVIYDIGKKMTDMISSISCGNLMLEFCKK